MALIGSIAKGWGEMGKFGKAMAVFNVVEPGIEIAQARSQGNSMAASIGKGLASYAMFELFPGLGWGLLAKDMAVAAGQATKAMSDNTLKNTSQLYSHGFGGNFVDTQASHTMRQRGLAAIHNNGINARSVMGNEARMYSRGHYE